MASPKKRGEGTSCHHCKKRIRPNEMLKCTRGEIVPTNSRKRKRPCVKKYCLHCIKTFYSNQYLDDNNSGSFICPACRDECRCAACRRRVMKARLKSDGSALENEADNQTNSILESQTPDATNIEEGQVNGMLEILDSRPDVQDIIRRGMAMDFADDNAKILYVAHLIDQALTRPDVLALYYEASHGRSNNCRLKHESHKHINSAQLSKQAKQTQHNQTHVNSIQHNKKQAQAQEEEADDASSPHNGSNTSSRSSSRSSKGKRHHRSKHKRKRKHSSTSSSSHKATRSTSRSNSKHTSVSAVVEAHRVDEHIKEQELTLTLKTTMKDDPIKQEPYSMMHHLNGLAAVAAPQPATMSLSGGGLGLGIGFASFPPPMNIPAGHPLLSSHVAPALSLPFGGSFPSQETNKAAPLSAIMQGIQNNGNDRGMGTQGREIGDRDCDGDEVMSHGDAVGGDNSTNASTTSSQTATLFAMNVTPAVMMGGPPLASM